MDGSLDLKACLAAFASAFTQASRLFTLQLGEDGRWIDAMLLPLEARGDEALSDSYRYTVTCLSPEATVELKTLLGLPAHVGDPQRRAER